MSLEFWPCQNKIMRNKLLYVLQVYEPQLSQAHDVAELLHSIKKQYPSAFQQTHSMLSYRFDCPRDTELESVLKNTFSTFLVNKSTRRETDYPGGSNGMWCHLMQTLSAMSADEDCEYACALTTETDAIPLVADWDERLLDVWQEQRAKNPNIVVMGHHLATGDFPIGHINGNALFDLSTARTISRLHSCPLSKSWDTWFANDFARVGWKNIKEIESWYRKAKATPSQLQAAHDRGCVWLHGIKDDSGLNWVKSRLLK